MIDDVLVGCAFPEGPQGMNLGRIVAQKAEFPDTVPGATINRFCSSGLQTIALAVQNIQAGWADCVLAGGVESMSHVPMTGFYYQPDPDLVERDIDVYVSMGITAENVASKYGISREAQDEFALRSHQRALDAIERGAFHEEIIPVDVELTGFKDGRTETQQIRFETDEGPRRDTSLEVLAGLKPVFKRAGTVTAGNASGMSDGAAATVVMSRSMVDQLGVEPMGRLVGFSLAGVSPDMMGIGPVEAFRAELPTTSISLGNSVIIVIDGSLASQALAVINEAGLDPDKVNVNGGAIALGHPLGCTGAKLTSTLLHELQRRSARYGICTMCVGAVMGKSAVFENLRR